MKMDQTYEEWQTDQILRSCTAIEEVRVIPNFDNLEAKSLDHRTFIGTLDEFMRSELGPATIWENKRPILFRVKEIPK